MKKVLTKASKLDDQAKIRSIIKNWALSLFKCIFSTEQAAMLNSSKSNILVKNDSYDWPKSDAWCLFSGPPTFFPHKDIARTFWCFIEIYFCDGYLGLKLKSHQFHR